MGTMKLIASNGEVKKIKFRELSAEDIEESLKQVKEHWNDQLPKFYDYPSMLLPIEKAPLRNADQLLEYEKIASKYGKKIEGINYDKCSAG